ncbi:YsnF/AvaK domain-containing protein [Acidipila sp. EB88]|uniref:YsnF/AvaK domain-containing protein n=1 Tax=Acidipila sp. EB88 TaxID=2305226 RepID=UPI001315389F|nr:YsnF/AvaK domain-containing protein [Acidipila sp. EB88]
MATSPVANPTTVAAFFITETRAAQAITALTSAGFHAHEIGAATNGEFSGVDTMPAASSPSSAGNLGGKTEAMWDKVKNFFDGSESTSNEGGIEQYADEHARDRSSHEITGGSAYEAHDVSSSLEGMSLPESQIEYFERKLQSRAGGVVVTVNAGGRAQEAQAILEEHGGDLGSTTSGAYEATSAVAATSASEADVLPVAASAVEPAAGTQRIQLLGEVLRVHKDRVSRGEVRIRKEIITEQQMVQVPVTHEELVIERIPVTGQTAVQGAIGENSEVRIPLSEEIASLDKQTIVREEVAIGKRAVEEVQEVGGAVRHEELQVEDATDATVRTSDSIVPRT